ncbi:MAG: peptide chain release factor N(5)-glutamine methyltransferase [bacterium]
MKKVVRELSKEFDLDIAETELIVSTLLRKPRFELYLSNNVDEKLSAFLRLKLMQLKKGVPIEYLTKEVQFFKYHLQIYPGVFIPRLETEYFIELITELIDFSPARICEIGTGSGAIAIVLADSFPAAEIIATDICPLAIQNAKENISMLNLKEKIKLLRADLFQSFSYGVFDLIVCNPPYIPTERIISLPKSVRDFEPRRAIDGGFGGTTFIKKIIEQAPAYLTKKRFGVALEIDEDEADILDGYLKGKFTQYFFCEDLFGKTRYLFIGQFRTKGV